jgi:hypothetical protein
MSLQKVIVIEADTTNERAFMDMVYKGENNPQFIESICKEVDIDKNPELGVAWYDINDLTLIKSNWDCS